MPKTEHKGMQFLDTSISNQTGQETLPSQSTNGLNIETNSQLNEKHLTIDTVIKALVKKINAYNGGIKGVWAAIDPQFKAVKTHELGGIKGTENKEKISWGAFSKQFKRFEKLKSNKHSSTEKFTFTVKKSFLLLLNIFEILGISSMKDLLGESFKKEDIDSVNRETNINSREILDKLNEIQDKLSVMSQSRTTRFPISKVCYDIEDIVKELHSVINYEPQVVESEMYNIIKPHLKHNAEQCRLSIMAYEVMTKYKLYFFKDIFLHKFSKDITDLYLSDYKKNHKLFLLSPLYILYFFTTVNNKFLSVIVNNEKSIHKEFKEITDKSIIDNNIKNNKMPESLSSKLVEKDILVCTNDIHKYLNRILSFYEDEHIITDEKYVEYHSIMNDTIGLFFNLYTNKTNAKNGWVENIYGKARNINDINFLTTVGNAIKFIPSEDDIQILQNIKNRLDKVINELIRD